MPHPCSPVRRAALVTVVAFAGNAARRDRSGSTHAHREIHPSIARHASFSEPVVGSLARSAVRSSLVTGSPGSAESGAVKSLSAYTVVFAFACSMVLFTGSDHLSLGD